MESGSNQLTIKKKELWYVAIPLLLLIPIFVYSDQLYGVFKIGNYIFLHIIIQILIVVFAMAIAIQTWLVFPHLLSNQTLYIGALFFVIALLEIANIDITASHLLQTSYINIWLQTVIRVCLGLGFLLIVIRPIKQLSLNHRILTYGLSSVLFIIMLIILDNPPVIFQSIIVDGIQLSIVQNIFQLIALIVQVLTIIVLAKDYKKMPKRVIWLISASVYLIVSDILFVVSTESNAIERFLAIIYQFYAYFFFLKAIYYTSVEKPYQQLLHIKQDLEQSQKELQFQAFHDDITQLPNERLLLKTLRKDLCADNEQKALIVIEIDRLATIRSSIGISYSNNMLKLVANRIQEVLPPHYFLTKLREDQFVIYVDLVQSEKELIQFCHHLHNVMKKPLQVQHFSLTGQLNIGIALSEEENLSGEEFLMQAQLAMREASLLPQRILVYKPYMSEGIEDRIIIEQELHKALDNNEFYLEYQPQVNLKTGKIESVEALVRWRHPTRGFVSPAQFIPIAEESGLIIPLGKWILETACAQAKAWESHGLPKMKVAVNLSLGQLFQQDLVQMVEDILLRTKLDPYYLQLEITESMTMNIDQMTLLLRELKSLGIQIAVDDFGTGYSSLSYLKDFPIDCLKIDRAFVRNIQHDANDEALVSMILSMAKHLRLKVVAEGIEEVAQLAFLIKGDCDYIQGYLFSKPIAAEQLTKTFNALHLHADGILGQFNFTEEFSI